MVELLNKGFEKTLYESQGYTFYQVEVHQKSMLQKIYSHVRDEVCNYTDVESEYYCNLDGESLTIEVLSDFTEAQYCFNFDEWRVYNIAEDENDYRDFLELVKLLPDKVKLVD